MCGRNGGSAAGGWLYLPCYQLQGSVAAVPDGNVDGIGYVDGPVGCGADALRFQTRA